MTSRLFGVCDHLLNNFLGDPGFPWIPWWMDSSFLCWPHLAVSWLNVAIHNLPHFRVSSKHVAGSISEGAMRLTLKLCRCLSKFGPKRES